MKLSRFNRVSLLGVSLLGAGAVNAAPIDVAAVVTDIGAQAAPIIAIGGAVLLIHVGVKAFRWVRSALS